MTEHQAAKSFPLLGIIFIIAGVLILILALLNYLQDGKVSPTIGIALIIIFLGTLLYSRGKKPKEQDK